MSPWKVELEPARKCMSAVPRKIPAANWVPRSRKVSFQRQKYGDTPPAKVNTSRITKQ